MGSFWHVFGIILTLVSTVGGAGIGWGAMRAGLTDLKAAVDEFRKVAQDVQVLKADSPKIWSVLDDHGKRIGKLEVDFAGSMPVKSRRRNK